VKGYLKAKGLEKSCKSIICKEAMAAALPIRNAVGARLGI
jgi:hypothetical protein